jgi:MFS transporter, ACS family, tartrate transporter
VSVATGEGAERRAIAKATKRLIPFLFAIYCIAYLDRVNVSFAQLQLEDDLGFSDTIFGLGAGIFSLGYVIFGVPSNLALERFGARRWLAGIMIVWGLISASMLFIESAASFYVLRFMLGVAEAGFFPGIVLYLTWWFPEEERSRALALFMTAISASYVAGGPLSGGLLELDGLAGLDGWQWLFLCEGLPAVALGFYTLRFLTERPAEAEWLEPDERAALTERMRKESAAKEELSGQGLRDALRSGQVWLLAWIYFILLAAGFGLTFFVPDLVQERTGYTDFEVGVLAAIPYGFATAAMLWIAREADRSGRRRLWLIAPALLGAAGAALTAYAQSPVTLTLAITMSAVGLLSAIPVFWSLPTAWLSGTAAAGGIALIAAIGNLGGFAGPAFTGVMEDSTGDFTTPFVVLAVLVALGCLLALLAREESVKPSEPPAAPAPAPAEVAGSPTA